MTINISDQSVGCHLSISLLSQMTFSSWQHWGPFLQGIWPLLKWAQASVDPTKQCDRKLTRGSSSKRITARGVAWVACVGGPFGSPGSSKFCSLPSLRKVISHARVLFPLIHLVRWWLNSLLAPTLTGRVVLTVFWEERYFEVVKWKGLEICKALERLEIDRKRFLKYLGCMWGVENLLIGA